MKTFPVDQFTHNAGTYLTEASDLGLKPGEVPQELGITHRSGVVNRFVFQDFDRNADGDVAGFRYLSTNHLDRMLVIND